MLCALRVLLLLLAALGVVREAENRFAVRRAPPAVVANHPPKTLGKLTIPKRDLLGSGIQFELNAKECRGKRGLGSVVFFHGVGEWDARIRDAWRSSEAKGRRQSW